MILLAEGSSRHGEGYCPGLSWIFRHLLSRCSEWSLGRERHRGGVTMSSARTQLSSHHRCYNFSWVGSLWRAEAWDRWPEHTGRAPLVTRRVRDNTELLSELTIKDYIWWEIKFIDQAFINVFSSEKVTSSDKISDEWWPNEATRTQKPRP